MSDTVSNSSDSEIYRIKSKELLHGRVFLNPANEININQMFLVVTEEGIKSPDTG